MIIKLLFKSAISFFLSSTNSTPFCRFCYISDLKKLILLFGICLVLFNCGKDSDKPASSVIQTPTPEPKETTIQYTLTLSAGDGGSVSSEGGTFDEGTKVEINASALEGYEFTGWSDDNIENPRTVVINSNFSIQAQFRLIEDLNTPFQIYDTSFETHEFNNGYYSYHSTNLSDNGMLVVGIAYCDFNNDGNVDIIGKDENSPNHIKLYTNDGNGYYISSILNIDNDSEYGFSGVRKIITSDVNNDDLLDIIYCEAPDDTINPRGLFVLRNNGSTFTKFTLLNGERDWIHSVTASDIDNDGNIDIFAGGKGYVFMGNGDFTFTKKDLPSTMIEWDEYNQSYLTKGASQEMIDINNDGYVDILMGYHISMDGTTIEEQSNTHVIHYGTGDDSLFTEAYVLHSDYNGTNITHDFSVNDFDYDGDLDLFVNSSFNYQSKYVIQYYENNGYRNFVNKTNEVFENESNLVTNHYDIDWIKFVDVNDDGVDELMIEGVNYEIQENQRITPSFNGWGLNENNKLIRKKY